MLRDVFWATSGEQCKGKKSAFPFQPCPAQWTGELIRVTYLQGHGPAVIYSAQTPDLKGAISPRNPPQHGWWLTKTASLDNLKKFWLVGEVPLPSNCYCLTWGLVLGNLVSFRSFPEPCMFSWLPKLCISGKYVCGGGRGASQHGLLSFSNPLCSTGAWRS